MPLESTQQSALRQLVSDYQPNEFASYFYL